MIAALQHSFHQSLSCSQGPTVTRYGISTLRALRRFGAFGDASQAARICRKSVSDVGDLHILVDTVANPHS